jgi:anti-sigma regulatory factor (Ser/Thr protein kinase)
MTFQHRRAHQLDLKVEASAAGYSREFVRQVCSSWTLAEDRIDIAALLASELVTNAVQASAATEPQQAVVSACADLELIEVRLLQLQDSFVIEVWDNSPQPPKLIEPSVDTEHGRGLQLVNALSIRWGYYSAQIGSKVVWCEISRDEAPSANGFAAHDQYQTIREETTSMTATDNPTWPAS